MARQDLAYQIAVNDAELRLATQHVAAFNAELEASTVTGKKLDTQLASIGRRTSQVGNFFTRNLTIPLVLAGAAAAKSAGQFDTAIGKIQGLVGGSAQSIQQLRQAALSLSSRELTQGPTALANALFFLRSVGLSTSQSIAALKPISEAASAGLGDIGTVAEAVTSAMDAYGFANLKANQATAVLIQTVTKGKIPPDQLASAIGRVIPVANALGISFDQVGASIASLTRQGLNANLAATGLRAVFSTLIKPTNQTQNALAAVGTSADAVATSMKKVGVFPTLIALRQELGHVNIDTKTLTEGFNGNALALDKIKASVGTGNQALAKLFPNVRALTAFLILTGPRRSANANIFDSLAKSMTNADAVIKQAFGSQQNTPLGQLNTQISELKANSQGIGDGFLKAGAKIVGAVNSVLNFVHGLSPGTQKLVKEFALFLVTAGPLIALFGRLTQAARFFVYTFGGWQTEAQKAAQAVAGINIEEDKLLIAQRKATTVFVDSMAQMQAAAGKTTKAIEGIGAAQTAAAVRAATASQGAAAVVTGRATGKSGQPGTSGFVLDENGNVDTAASRVAILQRNAVNQVDVATVAATAAQENYDKALALALPNQITYAKTQLDAATAALALAKANAQVLFPADEKLLVLTQQLTAAQRELVIAQQQGAGESIAAAKIASLQTDIALRQRQLATSPVVAGPVNGGFASVNAKAEGLQAADASAAVVTQARIMRTGWATAIEGMKSVSKLGFDFIAITFGIDVAQKIIGNSAQTKKAVTSDLLSINKAGVGALAAIGTGAIVLGPKLAGAMTSLRGGTSIFEALGVSALGWRAKVALVIASIFGLQKAGVGLETVFNAVSVTMLVRFAAVRLGIIEAGAAFGPFGIAFAVAATLIVAKSQSITNAIYGISGALGITGKQLQSFGVANFNVVANMLEELKGATSESQKRAIVEKVIAGSTATSAEKAKFAAQFLGQSVADQLTASNLLKKNLETQISGYDQLSPKIKADIQLLDKLGKPQAAIALAQAAQAKTAAAQVASAKSLLADLGQTGVANLLDGTVQAVKDAQTKMAGIISSLEGQVTKAFENHTDRMLDTFDEQTSSILSAFDAQTTKMENALKVSVNVPSLKEKFVVTVSGQTPAERELAALDKLQQRQNFQRDILSANQGLSQAQQIGDPVAIQAAQQKVQDAENERKQFILQSRADTERKAADLALTAGKNNLDSNRAQQRQQLSDARDAARRNLQAARDVEEQQIKSALGAQLKLFNEGKIGVKKFYTDILGIMSSHNISLQQAGADGGQAYTKAFSFALNQLKRQVTTTLGSIADTTTTATGTIKKNLTWLDQAAAGLQGNTPGLSVLGTPSIAGIQAAGESKAGVPTRPALLDALLHISPLALNTTDRAAAIKALPQNGSLTFDQYYSYLQKVPKNGQTALTKILQGEGFYRAAGGGVVPGSHGPPWHAEGPQYYRQAFDFFHRYSKGAPYQTRLSPTDEAAFQLWLTSSGVSSWTGYNAKQRISDYDYRGFWKNDPKAADSWRPGQHFPDTYKAPYDTTFSRESKYASSNNPFDWRGNDLVNLKTGRVIFSPRGEGGKVPGSGAGDVVPAMLTPGEVVLNAGQQGTLAGMLGMPGAGPHALFNYIKDRGGRFADGGVAGGNIFAPPGGNDPNDLLNRLLNALAKNAQRRSRQFNAGLSGIPTGKTIAGRNTSGAGFVKNILPSNVVSLVNHMTKGLDRDSKLALDAQLAQAQAHPVATGLLSVTPTSTRIGTNPQLLNPAGGSLSASGLGQPIVIEGDFTIQVAAGPTGKVDVDDLLGKVRKIAKRTPRQRGGRPLKGRLGLN